MRPRRRYLVFEISGARMGRNDAIKALKSSFRLLLNSELNRRLFKLVFYDARSQRGLLRCGHKQVNEVKTVLTGKEKICNKRVSFRARNAFLIWVVGQDSGRLPWVSS